MTSVDLGTIGRPKHHTLADQAAARLHEAILRGDLPGGTPLKLNDLAVQLGMSMMPVRDAIRRLEGLGLVEVKQHKGAWVRTLSTADAEDSFQTRLLLEVHAAQLAASRFEPEDVSRARIALESHISGTIAGDQELARISHTEFHFAIYSASGSHWLLRAIETVWQNVERYRFAGLPDLSTATERAVGHGLLLEACASHDENRAADAMRHHIMEARDRTIAKMSGARAAHQEIEG